MRNIAWKSKIISISSYKHKEKDYNNNTARFMHLGANLTLQFKSRLLDQIFKKYIETTIFQSFTILNSNFQDKSKTKK